MTMPAEKTLTPWRTRRNRMLLAAVAIVLPSGMCWWAGVFSHQPQPGPLLVAVSELPADGFSSPILGNQPAPPTPRFVDSHQDDRWLMPPAFHVAQPASSSWMSEAPTRSESDVDQVDLDSHVIDVSAADINALQSADDVRWFNGRPARAVRTIMMTVTGYSPDERSCGDSADGVTASGYSVWTNGMKMAAADTRVLPFGSLISVPGYDNQNIIPVLDRGGAIKGRRLDLLYPTHEQARQWGVQVVEVTVWEYADGKPHDFVARFNAASAVKR